LGYSRNPDAGADRLVFECGDVITSWDAHGHANIPKLSIIENDPLPNAVVLVLEARLLHSRITGLLVYDFDEMLPLAYVQLSRSSDEAQPPAPEGLPTEP
jgi:hypothetical protein